MFDSRAKPHETVVISSSDGYNLTHQVIDMTMLGSMSHQYQSPALENTAISSPTKIPL